MTLVIEQVARRTTTQRVGLLLGPSLFALILVVDLVPGNRIATHMAAIAALMATWWITDAIPLYATALLPVVLYPLMGVQSTRDTAPIYMNSIILLFLGGFMIALAMEKWGLHRRIALSIIRVVGGGPSRIMLGFMVAAAFLSMWISNTATAIMMVPIALAIIYQLEERFGADGAHRFTVGLLLGIAYACSIGGVATLVGTPPNLSFARIFSITFPEAPTISFGQWFLFGLPLATTMLLLMWFILARVMYKMPKDFTIDASVVREEYRKLGRASYEERVVLIVFVATALLWLFRRDLTAGSVTIPGWSSVFPFADLIDDGTIAIAMALVLFLVPTRSPTADTVSVMPTDVVKRLPWSIVILFGGGFALASGFQVTGLAAYIGEQFQGVGGIHPLLLILLICAAITFLTELTSNTATTEMILPILAAVAVAIGVNPLLLMVPATVAASHAFMMPVATPPNAIIFGSQRVHISEMARTGLVINLIGIVVITGMFYTVGTAVFDIDTSVFPEWATDYTPPAEEE